MIIRVAILSLPIRRSFDYLPIQESQKEENYPAGIRVKVPFGRQQRVGIVIEVLQSSSIPEDKLKPILNILDSKPLLPPILHKLMLYSANYYHHHIGEVYESALPVLLRRGKAATEEMINLYCATTTGDSDKYQLKLKRAPRQKLLLDILQQHPDGMSSESIRDVFSNWNSPMAGLIKRGLVIKRSEAIECSSIKEQSETYSNILKEQPLTLNSEQQRAVDLSHHLPLLLQGVTGSGKTEVYLQIIQRVLESGKQALLLVPEISLTPQTVQRFRDRFNIYIVLLHSKVSDSERLNGWLQARNGEAGIVIGTRSAIFTPLKYPGVIIIDEEHDGSFKQQSGFRYSARDIAVLRGREEKIPVILGSATPSFESLYNVTTKKYLQLPLTMRAGGAKPPQLSLIDVRSRKMRNMLSSPLLEKIHEHLSNNGQVLLFLNRRGYAPVLLCHHCGWSAVCERCDINYTYHQQRKKLICHHCGSERPKPQQCPECGSSGVKTIGAGTEQIEEALQNNFSETSIARIDRDTTSKKGALDRKLEQIHSGDNQILLGTQMLAKGHHFPNVTLVAILDADGGLFGSDFRSSEQMGQLITQVSGRAGREKRHGEVVIQTHNPDHPLLITLLKDGYPAFAKVAMNERKLAQLPPYSRLALIRADAIDPQITIKFLSEVSVIALQLTTTDNTIEILGPVPSPMEKRAGRYRAQLLFQSTQRKALHTLLETLTIKVDKLKSARKVRWSLDVDPMDML